MKEMTVDAKLQNIEVLTAFADAVLEEADCPPKAMMQIDLAIDELITNIASYAYAGGEGSATLQIGIQDEPRCAVLTFVDSGIPYDPTAKEDPDVTRPIEERQAGGLGIFLVKKTMDDMQYTYKDGQNILTIKKFF